tara:strand:- start:5219 stop:5788 length:570 start_codon:yes stop_codon:yes gene_type:complete
MKNFIFYFLKIYSKLLFRKNSTFGKKFVSGPYGSCTNNSGNLGNILIGDNCEVHGSLISGIQGQIIIGNFTTLRYNTRVFSVSNIFIGSHVIISNNVTIYDNNNHPISPSFRLKMSESGFYSDLWGASYSESSPIIIEDNVWIGERCYILKGVTIGKGSIIGLNSVVTKNIPPFSIAVGNPARVVKSLE